MAWQLLWFIPAYSGCEQVFRNTEPSCEPTWLLRVVSPRLTSTDMNHDIPPHTSRRTDRGSHFHVDRLVAWLLPNTMCSCDCSCNPAQTRCGPRCVSIRITHGCPYFSAVTSAQRTPAAACDAPSWKEKFAAAHSFQPRSPPKPEVQSFSSSRWRR